MVTTIKEYSEKAARTINKDRTKEELMYHALFGLASEVGEVHSIFQKKYQGHKLTDEELKAKLKDELGDVAWMLNEAIMMADLTLEEVLDWNIQKLIKRYPDGFSEERSVNRVEYQNKK